ncbi:hypothetical protein BDZ89DRAFT_1216562 [Hymenopellis radicata]|nr:hypothetical protein BDZ89DRAFT_1216562 [Hymenopellis radicata]
MATRPQRRVNHKRVVDADEDGHDDVADRDYTHDQDDSSSADDNFSEDELEDNQRQSKKRRRPQQTSKPNSQPRKKIRTTSKSNSRSKEKIKTGTQKKRVSKPPQTKQSSSADWETLVAEIHNVQRENVNGDLMVYFVLVDGRHVKESSEVCHAMFPQKRPVGVGVCCIGEILPFLCLMDNTTTLSIDVLTALDDAKRIGKFYWAGTERRSNDETMSMAKLRTASRVAHNQMDASPAYTTTSVVTVTLTTCR